jgi:hypothetical protein
MSKAAQSKIQNPKSEIVLASASPRRRELLEALGVQFDVRPANINEDPLPGESPLDTQHRITREKARAAERLEIGDWRLEICSISNLQSPISNRYNHRLRHHRFVRWRDAKQACR